ncbi:flippase [Clostridium saccharobutylicum]|uniref:Putative O-antigen transporter n=1 Tax=Clostridium saccharobutylicum TaxID=169679 RepID=A0A1S8NJX9_CLOSA|nr:flippase [Clostridium saccharobutylicum]OOM16541.1 putative O-antigen transporter [Clostridium saccharobutylicum]
MSKSIAKNFIYNLLLQIVTLLMPLITVPYVSRILGKEGVGVYSYTLSIVQYFVILGSLGVSMYGNRQIAYVRDDKEKMSKTFWAITVLKFITTIIALGFYMFIFGFDKKYGNVYLIQSINIIAATIDISWLYMGLEDFKKTVIRNLLVKIFGVICIFIFVKSYDDLYKYISINALMILLGNLVMWMYVPKTVLKIKIKVSDIVGHIVPAIQLFIPQIATQIYLVLDKTMLGTLANTGEVGLYEQSEKIIKLVLGLVTSLGVVMLPRMSNTFANGDNEKMDAYLNKSLQGVSYVSIPMAIGLASISNEFVPWFFGKDFSAVSYLMIILTPILFFIAISNVLGIQYLLPTDRTNEFTASVTMGAIINVILNFMLIPQYKAIGTCIATVIAEFVVVLVQYISLRKNIKTKILLKSIIKYAFSAAIMFIVVRFIGIHMGAKIITTVVQGAVGVIIYALILILFKEEINLIIFKTVMSKLKILSYKNHR